MTLRLGLLCPEVPGHLNPLSTLGGELRKRGHEITLIAPPSRQHFADREGLDFAAIGEKEDANGEMAARWERLGEGNGFFAMRKTARVLYASAAIGRRDLPGVLRTRQLDGLIVDQFSPGGAVVANQLGMPFVVACNALVSHFDWRSPPPPMLWRFRDNTWGRARNTLARLLTPAIYHWWITKTFGGVKPLLLVFEQHHGLAHIAQQPEFFDFPRDRLPEHFHYTSPWHRPDRDDHLDFPWNRLDDRPLVYASMGTLQNRLQHVFRHIVETVRGLDLQMVLTLGGSQVSLGDDIPENVLVTRKAPQLRVLERADIAITHAGLNTALECVVRGVPMVCMPVTNDQPGVSRRVEWLGLGKVQNLRTVQPERLRKELLEVLQRPHYRERAHHFRDEVAKTNGLDKACRIIEQGFRTGKKVLRETFSFSETPPLRRAA